MLCFRLMDERYLELLFVMEALPILVRFSFFHNGVDVMEDPKNSLLSSYCIKKIRRGIRNEDQIVDVTICYSSPNPNLTMKCFFDKNDQRQGKFTVFDGSSAIIVGTFVNDLMEGNIIVRHRNGNSLFEGFYRNGRKEGFGTEYTDGVCSFRGNFYNDKRNGPGDEFDKNGQIISSKFYCDGIETQSYVKGDILFVYKDNCLTAVGEFDPVSYRLEGYGALYMPGSHTPDDTLWKAGVFSDGSLVVTDRVFDGSIMREYKEQRKVYEGGYRRCLKEFKRFGDGVEYWDNGYVCITYYNEFGEHGFFLQGPSVDRLLQIKVEEAVYGLIDADDCSICRYENGKMVENWRPIRRRQQPDCCSSCCVESCVCIPNRKKYQSAIWLQKHCYLYWVCLTTILCIVGLIYLFLTRDDCSNTTLHISSNQIWEGDVCQNQAQGKGKMFVNGRLVYEGECANNMFHGYGTSFYENGNREFNGTWKLNQKANGCFYSSDGFLVYNGDFEVDKYNGKGDYYYPTGQVQFSGSWLNNELIQGKYFNLLNCIIYEGAFSDYDSSQSGLFYYSTGDIMFNLTWTASGSLFGSYYGIDHSLIYEGDRIDKYYSTVTSITEMKQLDPFVGFLSISLNRTREMVTSFEVCSFPFLYTIQFDTSFNISFSSISLYNNSMLYSVVFTSLSPNVISKSTVLTIRDNPNLTILVFDPNSFISEERLVLESIKVFLY